MKFSRFNNPNKKRHHKKLDRCEADIIVSRMRFDDAILAKGTDKLIPPMSYYDAISDQLCDQPSRHIY